MKDLISELQFSASRSSGKGGQHVNKVSTKVELRFDVVSSEILSDEEKEKIIQKLAHRLSKDFILILTADQSRSQLKNKKAVIERFYELLEMALVEEKERKKTKPSRASKEKRITEKKKRSDIKTIRRKKDFEDQ